jgi:hypothetical protein
MCPLLSIFSFQFPFSHIAEKKSRYWHVYRIQKRNKNNGMFASSGDKTTLAVMGL